MCVPLWWFVELCWWINCIVHDYNYIIPSNNFLHIFECIWNFPSCVLTWRYVQAFLFSYSSLNQTQNFKGIIIISHSVAQLSIFIVSIFYFTTICEITILFIPIFFNCTNKMCLQTQDDIFNRKSFSLDNDMKVFLTTPLVTKPFRSLMICWDKEYLICTVSECDTSISIYIKRIRL